MSDRVFFAVMATGLIIIAAILLMSCTSVASLFWRDQEIAVPEPTPRVEDLDDLLPELEYQEGGDAHEVSDRRTHVLRPEHQSQLREVTGAAHPTNAAVLPCTMQPRPRPCPSWDSHCDQARWTWATHWPQFGPAPSYGRWECK